MDIMTEAKPAETLTRRVKLIFTVSIYAVFVGFGLSASMLSPARLDIAELVGSDFEHVSIGTSIKAGAGCVGALFFGWFFTKVNRQLGMVTCIFVAALSMFVVPFLRKLWLYYASEVGNGIFAFGIDVAGNAWILEIWQEDANPYMQGMHFSFALGLALGPLYLEPFLSPDRNMTDDRQSESEWNRNGTAGQESRIVVPYTISTIFMITTGALMLYLHFRIPYKELKRSVSSPKSSDISDSNNLITNPVDVRDEKRYYLSLIVLGSLLLCFYTGLELSTMNFLPDLVCACHRSQVVQVARCFHGQCYVWCLCSESPDQHRSRYQDQSKDHAVRLIRHADDRKHDPADICQHVGSHALDRHHHHRVGTLMRLTLHHVLPGGAHECHDVDLRYLLVVVMRFPDRNAPPDRQLCGNVSHDVCVHQHRWTDSLCSHLQLLVHHRSPVSQEDERSAFDAILRRRCFCFVFLFPSVNQ